MTNQEVFDKVVTGLLKQARYSIDGDSCSYYKDGCRCAIGLLATVREAKKYARDILNRRYSNSTVITAVAEKIDADFDFLCYVQAGLHDTPALQNPRFSRKRFLLTAKNFAYMNGLVLTKEVAYTRPPKVAARG
jgi:hypothetical protein